MTFLRWADYPAWALCAGRPALEDSEGPVPDIVPRLTATDKNELENRRSALAGATALEILPLQAIDVGAITGERGATAWGSVILAEYQDHSALEVYPADRILGLAALVKYSIIHQFTNTNVGTPAELYAFGAEVTEAAQLSLNLRASVTALEHLVPGDYCKSCRAAYRCPALAKTVHETVYGPLESPQDPEAIPIAVDTANADALQVMLEKLPMVEAWVAAVKAADGVTAEKPVKRRRKKVQRRRRIKSTLSP